MTGPTIAEIDAAAEALAKKDGLEFVRILAPEDSPVDVEWAASTDTLIRFFEAGRRQGARDAAVKRSTIARAKRRSHELKRESNRGGAA